MTAFVVASFNIGDTGRGGDLATIARTADVICLQEAGDRGVMLRAFMAANPGWELFEGTQPGAGADPILVNVEKLGQIAVLNHRGIDSRRVGRGKLTRNGWSAAGPSPCKPKPITQFVLANGTSIFNLHALASITKTRQALGTFTYEARRKHFRDHLYALLSVTTTLDGPVIVVGDLNAEPDFELLDPLHNVGFTGWTTEGTHGNRAIDHVLHLPDRGLTAAGRTRVLPTASDHDAVLAPFNLEPLVPDPYARTTFRGKPLDYATVDALKVVESRLGYELTINQGIGGAPASAGTHLEGRAVDLVDWDSENKVRELKDVGFAAYRRERIPGVWNSHIHAVLILETRGNPRGIAASALRQIESYDRGRDGLAGDRPDPSYRPNPRVNFHYPYEEPPVPPTPTKVNQARDQIVKGIHAVSLASALADEADDRRAPIRRFTERLNAVEAELRSIATDMPRS